MTKWNVQEVRRPSDIFIDVKVSSDIVAESDSTLATPSELCKLCDYFLNNQVGRSNGR